MRFDLNDFLSICRGLRISELKGTEGFGALLKLMVDIEINGRFQY